MYILLSIYMSTVDHFMDSTIAVAQKQASGEVRQIGTYMLYVWIWLQFVGLRY